MYIIGLLVFVLIFIVIPYPELTDTNYYGLMLDSIYNSLVKTVFGIALIILLIPCIFSTEKYVPLILVNKITSFIGNLTYPIYLIHPIIFIYINYSIRSDIHKDFWNISLMNI